MCNTIGVLLIPPKNRARKKVAAGKAQHFGNRAKERDDDAELRPLREQLEGRLSQSNVHRAL